MEETMPSVPEVPASALDPTITEAINHLEKQLIANMDAIVEHLQSLQQSGSLDKATLNEKILTLLGLAQASLLISTLPLLLAPTMKATLQTAELFKKIHHIAETLKTLWKQKTMQAIDKRAAQILEQIQAKERQIKEQISKKQQEIAKLTQKFTPKA